MPDTMKMTKPNMTMSLDEFKQKIRTLVATETSDEYGNDDPWYYANYAEVQDQVAVDFENFNEGGEKWRMPGFSAGYAMIADVPVLWCACGGDWEIPVALCAYPGEDCHIHIYVPYSGNVWNFNTKCAIGNDCDVPTADELQLLNLTGKYDMTKMALDVEKFFKSL